MLELDHVAQVIEAQSFGLDRLSSEQLDQLKKHQESTMALEQRKNYFKTADHSKTFHGLIIPHIVSVLKSDAKLKSVLNIGCNYGYMDSIMAKQFPQVKFSGIDVNENIKEYNKDLILPNLEFISGYALEKLESNKLAADLVYFSSTATVIRNNELKKYFSILVNKSKYVAISEPIWPLPNKKIIAPHEISVQKSLPAFIQKNPLTSQFGYLCYVHNYKELLQNAGFKITYYNFFKPEFSYLSWVICIGEVKE